MRFFKYLNQWSNNKRSSRTTNRAKQLRRRCLTVEHMEDRALLSAVHDYVYIGDQGDSSTPADDTVKRFDAKTGDYIDSFVAPNAGGLNGPRGMVFRNPGTLLVANQNVNLDSAGEVLRFNGQTGAFQKATVGAQEPNAPFAPRGIVVSGNKLYVADAEGSTSPEGRIAKYSANNGKYLGQLTPSADFTGQFNPRGVVFGPDGQLYVSVFETTNPLAGHVLRFDTETGASQVVATNDGDGVDEPGETKDLHRPEGLVFGPNGQLYVTSFRADPTDNDKILVMNVDTGLQVDKIDLDVAGQPRAFAQAIEFGPEGRLFVPITGNGPETGSVRAYDVDTKSYTVFVQPAANGGNLVSPWYLTFGQTNPATLSYNTKPGSETREGTRSDAAAAVLASLVPTGADLAQKKASDTPQRAVAATQVSEPVKRAQVIVERDYTSRSTESSQRTLTTSTAKENAARSTELDGSEE